MKTDEMKAMTSFIGFINQSINQTIKQVNGSVYFATG